MKWSLITVTHNSGPTLHEFWSDVRLPPDVEWIVVDNNSTDDTVAIAESLGAKVVEQSRNRGFGVANNVGFDVSSGDFICFVNPDVRVDVAGLNLLEKTIRDQGVLVAPQLLNMDGSLQPNGRSWPFLAHKILHRLNPQRVSGVYTFENSDEMNAQVIWVIGAVVASSRDIFLRLGPWDKSFFLYYEDSDLCLRARQLGIRTVLVTGVQWTHGWGRATSTFRLKPWIHEISSMIKFYLRYPRLLSLQPESETRILEGGLLR